MPGVRVAAAVAVLLAPVGCGGGSAAGPDGRLRIVTTVAPVTSIVATVVGDRAVVDGLVPEGRDSHTFDPPPRVAELLARADLVVANGLHLEAAVLRLARTVAPDAPVLELGREALEPDDYIFDFSFPRSAGKPNPHLWTDPTYAAAYAEVVRDAVTQLDPGGAAHYRERTAGFVARARGLAAAMRVASATVPRRELLTYHDAYAYFARTFGWTVVGAVQPRDFADPTAREVARLIAQVRAHRVPAVFGSEVFPSDVLEQVGRATGARYDHTLRDDDLPGEPGDPEHSWFGLVRGSYVTMVRALGGEPAALEALPLPPAADTARYPQ